MHPPELLIHGLTAVTLPNADVVLDFLGRGGVFMVPLGVASVAGVMAILYKLMSLSRSRVIPKKLEHHIRECSVPGGERKLDAIMPELEDGRSSLARLAAVTVGQRGRPHDEITRAVEAASREETAHLHAGIGVIDVVITVAPLLGLLGTASGLVVIFEGLGETTNYLAIARGIAEALSTTIAGLAIAVPCVIAHSYFTRRIELLTARLESLLSGLASASADGGRRVS